MTNYRDTFERDLRRGIAIEEKVLEMVKLQYSDAYCIDGYCKEGDIYIPSINEYVEVKYDPMSQQTGNLVIEVEFNGRPSALSTTKSYRWVFYTGEEYIITSPDRIKKAVKGLPIRKFIGKGDKHPKLAYLAKKKLIMENAILIIPKMGN